MAISDEKYVLLTTFRKSGDAVATPVWIAPLSDGTAGFTTELNVGKVKRIRHTPRVTLQPCSVTGKVKPGAPVIEATAEVKIGADAGPIRKAIHRKYPVMVSLLNVPSFFRKLVRRRSTTPECAIQLTFG
jgi:PPOX class probable F420-dependent enzyme